MSAPEHDAVAFFLHVPKTGGTTLTNLVATAVAGGPTEGRWLRNGVCYYPAGFELPEWEDPEPTEQVRRLVTEPGVRAVVGHFHHGLHEVVDGSVRLVTMLRDPVDRTLSLHTHLRRHYGLAQTLEEFVEDPPVKEADNGQTRRLAGAQPPIGECDDVLAETAVDHLSVYDVVGVTEEFDRSVLLAFRVLGWPAPSVYYPMNVEAGRRAVEALPPGIRRRIEDRQRHDIRLHRRASEALHDAAEGAGPGFAAAVRDFRRARESFERGLPAQDRTWSDELRRRDSAAGRPQHGRKDD